MARLGDVRVAAALLGILSLFLLFDNLGGPALFDPDEGRNAEIAREILVTRDWVTPHYDFLPRLEKPIFFYALTAASYRLFGVSEGAARAVPAAAGLAILLLTYFFSRRLYGEWAALWSALVLVTSVQFGAFARIVIPDMALAFFVAIALFAYYRARAAEGRTGKRLHYFLMYAAVAGATLVKGPIGFVLPGMIVAAHIAAQRRWSILAEMELGRGALIFLLIAAPWYAWAEIRNPGYLAYFLGREHFARYLTPVFQRTKPWHYFFAVLMVGFLPWTFLLPGIARRLWKKPLDDLSLYLLLWIVVPFVFFSLSRSKMSEYLLPVYPALAILAGKTLADLGAAWETRPLALGWIGLSLSFLYFLEGLFRPEIFPVGVRAAVLSWAPGAAAATFALFAALVFAWTAWTTLKAGREKLFPLCCAAFLLLFWFAHRILEPLSLARSYRELGEQSAPLLDPGDRLV
ncbi:MAG TPA: glycosyltransferase family 39 protein, partial [Candidatus Binatia bacterium]